MNQEHLLSATDETAAPAVSGASRRHLLRTGAAGAAAAFLAACTKARKEEKAKPGSSGDPVGTTVPVTVPKKDPTAIELELDQTVLRTATSLELVVSAAYETYGPDLSAGEWKTLAAAWAADHAAAATVFRTASTKPVDEPNKFVQEHSIDPLEDSLSSDTAILGLFHDLESMLTATYVTAAGQFTGADWRQRVMTYGAAAARRVGVLADAGDGAIADSAVYPLADLISADAYEPLHKAKD